MILAVDPTVLRKAAAFAEKLARLEEEFGVRLTIPKGERIPFTLGDRPAAPFVLIRHPGSDALALGLETVE